MRQVSARFIEFSPVASSHLRLSGLEDLTPSEQRELMWTLKGLYGHFYNLKKDDSLELA